MFIAVEGVDGSGKSTVVNALAEHLRAQGRDVFIYTDFYTDPFSAKLGQAVKESSVGDICALAEVTTMTAMRANGAVKHVIPHLQRGGVVIADRYLLSTLAYQTASHAAEMRRAHPDVVEHWPPHWTYMSNVILPLHSRAVGLTPPYTIYLNVSANTAIDRIKSRGKSLDYFESRGAGYFEEVLQLFPIAIGEFKRFVHGSRPTYGVAEINAEHPLDDVVASAIKMVDAWMAEGECR